MKAELKDVSAVILAGGKSTRMGRNKAELDWEGTTLIGYHAEKLRSLGICDIILSGYRKPIGGTRFAEDIYPGKGPLGGIHAGLLAAHKPHCLVLSVDAPLVPEDTLLSLVDAHIASGNSITVISHGGRTEPLIGVYERSLCGFAEDILRTDSTSVRVLFQLAGAGEFEYTGDETLLFNCNTPSEYSMLLRYAGRALP